MTQKKFFNMVPLFLVLFIDTLGSAFIIPLLGPLFIDSSTSILSQTSTDLRNVLYGLTLGIYSIAAFFGSPILGDLSDRLGRKKILLICLFGVLIGYLIVALRVITQSVTQLILGRIKYVLSGLQGSQSIILKLGLNSDGLKREALALKVIAGFGVVKVLAENDGTLLLERAMPGVSLKSYFAIKDTEAIRITCEYLKRLQQALLPAPKREVIR